MEQTDFPGSRQRSVGSQRDAGAELPATGSVGHRQPILVGCVLVNVIPN